MCSREERYLWACGLTVSAVAAMACISTSLARGSKSVYDVPSTGTSPFCGLVAVATICSIEGIETNIGAVYRHAGVQDEGTSLADCQRALEELGVPSDCIRVATANGLPEGVPALCAVRRREGLHAVVVVRRGEAVLVIDGRRTFRQTVGWLDSVSTNLVVLPR